MRVSRISPMTGKENVMELDISPEQAAELSSPGRRLIQEIVPHLTAEEREFIKTGYTPEDWANLFPPGYEISNVTSKT